MSEPQEEQTPIGELMARDPLSLSSRDLDSIIATLRKQRAQYTSAGDRKIGTPATKKTAAQKKREDSAELLKKLDLDDLFSKGL